MTRRVRQFLDAQAQLGVKPWTEVMEPNECPDYLTRHLIRQIKSVLRSLPSADRRQRSLEFEDWVETEVAQAPEPERLG